MNSLTVKGADIFGTVVKVIHPLPKALSPRTLTGRLRAPRGRVDEETCPGVPPRRGWEQCECDFCANAIFGIISKGKGK